MAPVITLLPPPTLSGFRDWLRGLPEGSLAGSSGTCLHCPLARYLASLGYPCPVVTDTEYGCDTQPGIPLPDWARAFVEALDGPDMEFLTPARCLRVLAALFPEVAR